MALNNLQHCFNVKVLTLLQRCTFLFNVENTIESDLQYDKYITFIVYSDTLMTFAVHFLPNILV